MGKVLGAVAAAVVTIATGGTFLGFTGITAGLLAGASSLVLSGLSSALSPKPKASNLASNTVNATMKSGSITRQIRQPITPRRMVYGEMRVSGPYAFIGSTGSNEYLHFILMLASHEVDQIGEIWINDESVTPDMLNGSGDITSGKYSGYVRITKHLGTDTQTADSNMTGAFPEWTSDHRLQGIAYIYVRLKYNRDVWAGGIPNVSAWVRGKKVVDTRTMDPAAWHHNPMLILNDYLTDANLGVGVDSANIDDSFVDAGANVCEEFVNTQNIAHTVSSIATGTDIFTVDGETLLFQTGDRVQVSSSGTLPSGISAATDYFVIPYQRLGTPRILLAATYEDAIAGTPVDVSSAGSGTITITKNAEPRYSAGGIIDSDAEPQEAITGICSAMAGKAVYSGGRWRLLAGKYETPTIAFDEDDLAGSIIVQTKTSRRERFNRVIGTYTSPLNNGQPSDYPMVKNDTYATQDGAVIDIPFDLPFTQRPHTAQRLAKIKLEVSRQEIIFSGRFKLSAFKVQVGDNILMNNSTYSWTNKPFEVIEWGLQIEDVDGVAVPYIEMKLKETASTVYDWNNGEETAVDPAPNTSLPEVNLVEVVTGFSLTSVPINTREYDRVYNVLASWDIHDNQFVVEGGKYTIEYKETTDSIFKQAGTVDGRSVEMMLPTLKPDVLYDIQITAYNNLGAASQPTLIEDFQVGTTVSSNSEDWENESLARDGDDWESDTLDSEDWE